MLPVSFGLYVLISLYILEPYDVAGILWPVYSAFLPVFVRCFAAHLKPSLILQVLRLSVNVRNKVYTSSLTLGAGRRRVTVLVLCVSVYLSVYLLPLSRRYH